VGLDLCHEEHLASLHYLLFHQTIILFISTTDEGTLSQCKNIFIKGILNVAQNNIVIGTGILQSTGMKILKGVGGIAKISESSFGDIVFWPDDVGLWPSRVGAAGTGRIYV
jgi:hypothetical protein